MDEYLVLRRKVHEPALEAFELGGPTNVPVGAGRLFEATIEDQPPSGDGVLASAPAMPLQLIEPADSKPSTIRAESFDKARGSWSISAVRADRTRFTGRGVRVAILDTGIRRNHTAFDGVVIKGENFTADDTGEVDPAAFDDTNGHGTHCAGTLLGRDVDGHRIGVAPGVSEVFVAKVLGPGGGTTAMLTRAINWAMDNGARVISMSLGMDVMRLRDTLVRAGVHEREATSRAMRTLMDNVRFFDKLGNLIRSGAAFGRSAIVVAACGNESDRSGNRHRTGKFVLSAAFPAETEDFYSVGALEQTSTEPVTYKVADFSNSGAKLVAPGVDVLSADISGTQALGIKSGTSMATPHVAGIAALWAEKLGAKATAGQVMQLLCAHVVTPSGHGLDPADIGLGMPVAPES